VEEEPKIEEMKNILFLFMLGLLFGCAKMMEVGSDKNAPAKNSPPTQEAVQPVLNQAEVKQLENVIEIHQKFQQADNKDKWLSAIHTLEIEEVSFVRMSAFSLDLESNYVLHYRIYDKDQWGEWMLLPESKEKVNPNRKVFSGLNIFQEIQKIQFRSSNATKSPVVFRLFVAHNQN